MKNNRREGASIMNKNDMDFRPAVKLMFVNGSRFFGPGPVGLLKEIDRCGNVREACENCGFSYSKGWSIIRKAEEKFGCTIVERQAGGKSGGSARVSEKGRAMLELYDKLEAELSEIAEERFAELVKEYEPEGAEKE